MSALPSLCTAASPKAQSPLDIQGPDQNQDANSILPPIFHRPQIKSIAPLSLTSQNPVIKMPQSGIRALATPRSSRQFPPRISGSLSTCSTNSSNMETGMSIPISMKPTPPLKSIRKRNGNARRFKNNNNIILPPLEEANSIENSQLQQMQKSDKISILPNDVGDVYLGSGNELSDELEEEDEDEDDEEMFLRMDSGRLENASNRTDDDLNDSKNGSYNFNVSEPEFSS